MKGKLVLENGTTFYGNLLGGAPVVGEVVFNTGMTGYQEILTDPSYADQIITLTYPLIGNYGTLNAITQGPKPYCKGLIVGELCDFPSNWQNEGLFSEYLRLHGIPCLYDIDTRAITRAIRKEGVMKGVVARADCEDDTIQQFLKKELPTDQVMRVTTKWQGLRGDKDAEFHVAVYDFGVKENILHSLVANDCRLTIFPADAKAEDIKAVNPDGIFLSNGPGDPADLAYAVEEVKKLFGYKPIFGICMGHQVLAQAYGGKTYKLKFGHRGSNHPVKELATNRVYITSQNHGFAVDASTLPDDVIVTHVSVNDGTVEGMAHTTLPIFSIQYHPEASPGPTDNLYLFQQFKELMRKG
ncbi:glutamine-hydrolyzing carbamoyl-phosphate synthase small subunit [Veillonella montpellierensis]|uniref:glutamine-hydrolyzing carbamoyl-phosphate synthase small subunit n=1 Tax=Veillonella montpellierensis TaxID=187328 RepID=UPI0023F79CFC|nr:glutamine-hydrolyzing carbamoyl-phosphate synthase small subunit [Veillonella montpellierensis]